MDGRLSDEKERDLWSAAKTGDSDAREHIILAYRPLVFWIAKKFRVPGRVYPDLIQEGMLALIKSVDNFDPDRGFRFTTYGFYRIKGQMLNYLQRHEAKAPLPLEDMDEDLMDPMVVDRLDDLLDIRQGLERMPEREARILSELVLLGRSAKEVARDERLDVSHVYRLRRKALGWLRRWLQSDATQEV